MSLRASAVASPRACSGAMYAGVPTTAPVRVRRTSLDDATPKSTSLVRGPTLPLSGASTPGAGPPSAGAPGAGPPGAGAELIWTTPELG